MFSLFCHCRLQAPHESVAILVDPFFLLSIPPKGVRSLGTNKRRGFADGNPLLPLQVGRSFSRKIVVHENLFPSPVTGMGNLL